MKDPTRQEMLDHLVSVFTDEDDGFNSEAAMYWFANFWHDGQWSNLYSVLSTSSYSPGCLMRGPEDEDETVEAMVKELETHFA